MKTDRGRAETRRWFYNVDVKFDKSKSENIDLMFHDTIIYFMVARLRGYKVNAEMLGR